MLRCAVLIVFLAPTWLDVYRETNALQLGGRFGDNRKIVVRRRLRSIQKTRVQSTVSKRRYRVLDQEDEETMPHEPLVTSERPKNTSRVMTTQPTKRKRKDSSAQTIMVSNVEELRAAVLDQGYSLRDIELREENKKKRRLLRRKSSTENKLQEEDESNSMKFDLPLDHEVLNLITRRAQSGSIPNNRDADDNAHLALSIEGGGMRGAVSAGMVAAIASLGLCDAFDSLYGSSAGSTIGAYFVSRQMCTDVYTHILPEAKTSFVSKKRIMTSLVRNLANVISSRNDVSEPSDGTLVRPKNTSNSIKPGLNISYILDGVMCSQNGLRPLDLESFRIGDAKQPLRIVSSTVRDGKMETVCFGSKENDFFENIQDDIACTNNGATKSTCGERSGLYACLHASMTVPGATGPPINLIRNVDRSSNITRTCFDAFCYEPIPYRSAVEEGATHVLALLTRPEGCELKTKPGVYERAVASLYFKSHGQPEVAKFFENGGQQYIYLEDILTLDQARDNSSENGVPVPPPKVLYGIDLDDDAKEMAINRDSWKRAHLYPVVVPSDSKELSVLSQDKDDVLYAIRGGFATAFGLLAPAAGLDLEKIGLSAERVAELVFPDSDSNNNVKEKANKKRPDTAAATTSIEKVSEEDIEEQLEKTEKRKPRLRLIRRRATPRQRQEINLADQRETMHTEELKRQESPPAPCKRSDAKSLLAHLPTEPWTTSQLAYALENPVHTQ